MLSAKTLNPGGVVVRSTLKMRSSAVLATKSALPSAENARPLAPNGGKPWEPGARRPSCKKVLTDPVERFIAKIVPPKESETYKLLAERNASALRPQLPLTPPQTLMILDGTLLWLNGGENSSTLPLKKSAT